MDAERFLSKHMRVLKYQAGKVISSLSLDAYYTYDDLIQSATSELLRAFPKLDQSRSEKEQDVWVYRVIQNHYNDLFREAKKRMAEQADDFIAVVSDIAECGRMVAPDFLYEFKEFCERVRDRVMIEAGKDAARIVEIWMAEGHCTAQELAPRLNLTKAKTQRLVEKIYFILRGENVPLAPYIQIRTYGECIQDAH